MSRPRLVCRWVPDALEHYTAVLSEASRTDYHHDQTFKDGEEGGGRMSIEPQTHNPSREMDVDGNQFCDCGDYYPCPTVILQDLIAGLQVAIDDYEPRMHGSARAYLLGIRDRAEARLRGVSPEFPEGATVADVSMSLSKGHGDE